mmetsp:Transcript_8310/g.24983  ORF Transcript_8310/g.24983 Transcript_8310/m.24983 type:complete len:232 (-) Transcript_8310:565-1260(-)|eukprot:CAMPEP_0198723240 /NCGR_PEP_ID=MMETSP1475-20131203/783_1 /TAXON_ID= ORGANISM="Unidentified sp., Strain CCMP1999" /NCGR_SAMPLE_ID=MMETSP1475 /ASSEMBLY_ACC=CAM_ASM_001111 /LENGTH=231 /DNA_ID=CAMNT_0044484303 /DNA_START=38 /DNA_END=733 /DNA_ORIENTATION=-
MIRSSLLRQVAGGLPGESRAARASRSVKVYSIENQLMLVPRNVEEAKVLRRRRSVFVSHLSFNSTAVSLHKMFASAGAIERIDLAARRVGFLRSAVIVYRETDSALTACEELNGRLFMYKRLYVAPFREQSLPWIAQSPNQSAAEYTVVIKNLPLKTKAHHIENLLSPITAVKDVLVQWSVEPEEESLRAMVVCATPSDAKIAVEYLNKLIIEKNTLEALTKESLDMSREP